MVQAIFFFVSALDVESIDYSQITQPLIKTDRFVRRKAPAERHPK